MPLLNKKQKILVVYYSRTGNTKKIGDEIAKKLKADSEEIIDLKDRKRFIVGWLISGKDATTENTTEIKFKKDPSKYDLVIIGGPVWAWTITPAIRKYLSTNKLKKVAFFATCGSQFGKTFGEMEKLSKKPEVVLGLNKKEIKAGNYNEKMKEFIGGLAEN